MPLAQKFSPIQLSWLTSSMIALLASVIDYYFQRDLLSASFILLGVTLIGTWIINSIFQSLIQKQIKLIYKLIMQTRTGRKESFFFNNILPPKTIEEVREDVEQWARQHNMELEVLQKNEQYRKEFLQNLSHELKTPIFSIQGYVDTLLNGAIDNPEVNKSFLKNTSRNIDRLVNLVDDLDQISRLELGELKLSPEIFSIEDLIQEVYDAFSLRCEEAKILCTFKKDREKNLQVFADREKVRQVLVNIIDNAIKYGKVNGTIEAAFFKLDNRIALIEIRDDGDGIAEEHRQRIFERFYRTDHARSRKIGGSGLGLAICKHIMDAHQQTIYVRSTVQVGSTFCFSLPLKK